MTKRHSATLLPNLIFPRLHEQLQPQLLEVQQDISVLFYSIWNGECDEFDSLTVRHWQPTDVFPFLRYSASNLELQKEYRLILCLNRLYFHLIKSP